MTWPLLGVLSVRPGARLVIADRVRPVASVSTSFAWRFCPPWVVASIEGASAVTVTVSWTAAHLRDASTVAFSPMATVVFFSTVLKPEISNVAV